MVLGQDLADLLFAGFQIHGDLGGIDIDIEFRMAGTGRFSAELVPTEIPTQPAGQNDGETDRRDGDDRIDHLLGPERARHDRIAPRRSDDPPSDRPSGEPQQEQPAVRATKCGNERCHHDDDDGDCRRARLESLGRNRWDGWTQ